MNNAKIIVSKTDNIIQAGIKKVLSGGGGGPKIQLFFCFGRHILQKRKGVHANILSRPPSARQLNGVLLFG